MMPILLCLHGWGGSKESFTELRHALQGTDIEILTPDLPGFGSEPEPSKPWTIDDYADWAEAWLQKTLPPTPDALRPLFLLGHSHGGRIALTLAARQSALRPTPYAQHPIRHLFLCAAAGLRHPPTLKQTIGLTLAKIGKIVLSLPLLSHLQAPARTLLYKLLRSHDYERASPIMKQTLQNIIHGDVRSLLPLITIPTDIFWGEEDTMTPLADGEEMHAAIHGSTLLTFPGVRHRVHRDRATEIAAVIHSRLSAA